jgi:GxxExxY protein
MSKLILPDETFAIRGAIFEVYREKGCGFSEAIYQERLEFELQGRGVPFVPKPCLTLEYKGRPLVATFSPDLLCFGSIVVELKAVSELNDAHRAQLQNYLRSSNLNLGMLVNFGHFPGVEVERYIMQEGRFKRSAGSAVNRSVGI